jgi:hypothetical protein
VAVFRDPANPAGMGQFGAIQGAAPSTLLARADEVIE